MAVEQRGIELVSPQERYGRPRDLLFLWSGTTLGIFTLVYGTVVVSLGLSFPQAVAAIVIGNLLAFPLVGLTSLQGPAVGTSTMAVSRAAYGPRGARALGLFGWINMVGFEAGGMVLITFAALALLDKAGVHDQGTGLKVAVIVVAALIQLVLPLVGHAAVMKAQKYFTWVFVAMFAIMAVLVGPKVDVAAGGGADFATFTIAVALVMSCGGLSWAPLGSDYSRYLPANASRRAVFLSAALGGFVPYVLLMTLGAAVGTVVKDAGDPISGLPGALPGWFTVPYLVLAMVTLFAVNTTDLYSSGLNLQAAGINVKRWVAVVADLVICVAITYVAVMSNSFNELLNAFLNLLIIWLAPWAGVYLSDWLRRRGRYDGPALFDETPASPYWGAGGVRWPGIVAQVAGMAAAALWINSTAFVGPISQATGGTDFSVFAGVIVAGVVYLVLERGTARRPAAVPAEAAT
ncbi:purine-cytosine permease family protein [Microtetraspora niveoalba]|uniref:purine-cytosine permease family protein n=1 Tax=Microtetraspora niveoalba TaxID=46175 RepID=UPI00082DB7E8|nr:cytosine permease [Microtetraspora niveoalba]